MYLNIWTVNNNSNTNILKNAVTTGNHTPLFEIVISKTNHNQTYSFAVVLVWLVVVPTVTLQYSGSTHAVASPITQLLRQGEAESLKQCGMTSHWIYT